MKSLFLSILILLFCKGEKKIFPVLPESKPPGLHLEFGNLEEFSPERRVSETNWGLSLDANRDSFCFSSHSEFFSQKEWGPKLSICFPGSDEKSEIAASLLKEYETDTSVQSFVLWEGNGFRAKINFWTETQILKLLDEDFQYSFLGEKRLCQKRREKFPNEGEFEFCTSGKWKNIETSFSLPYFSLLVDPFDVYIFFPEPKFRSGSSRKYLGIHIEKTKELEELIRNFFLDIAEKQNRFVSTCKISPIVWTEGMGISSSHTGKFLEIHSQGDQSTCFYEFQVKVGEHEANVQHRTGYLLPNSYLLFISEDSRLEGEVYSEIPWKEVRSGKILTLSQNGFQDEWNAPYLGSVLDDIEFSAGKQSQSCTHHGTISFSKKFCGSPGLPNSRGISESDCLTNHFYLSELNSVGLKEGDVFYPKAKFLELGFSGNANCKNDYLLLKMGNRFHPFDMQEIDWNQSSLLLIGPSAFYQHINLLNRELGDWNPSHEIEIWDGKRIPRKLWDSKSNTVFFSKTKDTIYSVVFSGSEISHHPKFTPSLPHAMSPGQPNPNPPIISKDMLSAFHFSELNARGSYTERESYPADKFLEIFTPFPTSLLLSLSYSKDNFSYYLPSEYTYTVLAKNPLYCIESDSFFIDNDVLFPSEDVEWSLSISGIQVDNKVFSKAQESGLESRTQRIRASHVFTGRGQNWKNSDRSHPDLKPECQGYTLASPGAPNLFSPYFEDLQFGKWNLFFSKPDIYKDQEILSYSVFPPHNLHYKIIPTLDSIFFQPEGMEKGNLYYLHFRNGTEFSIFQRKKTLIQAVFPHPENSQNEWVLFCNHSGESIFVQNLEIIDQGFSDFLVPFQARFPNRNLISSPDFDLNKQELVSGSCAYILDPDSQSPFLFPEGSPPTLIWTVKSDSSIGNGISTSEGVDILDRSSGERVHLHSFRNQFSPKPWTESAGKGEIFYLKPGRLGIDRNDYEIRYEVNP